MADDAVVMGGMCCAGSFFVLCVVTLIIILTNIYRLGPEDQVVVELTYERYTVNGPDNVLLNPFRHKWERKATRLGPRDYAVVKERQGWIRHEEGPQLLWLGAWDELVEIKSKIVLQRLDYMRLVDKATGYERVEVGPQVFAPAPMDEAPDGTEQAEIVAPDSAVVTLNRTFGQRYLNKDEGPFFPRAYEEIIEIRRAVVVGDNEYITVQDVKMGNQTNIPGPDQVKIPAWSELNCTGASPPFCTRPKLVLEMNEHVRLVDTITGQERVIDGPASVTPTATEETQGVEKSVYVLKNTTIRLRNTTSVWVYPINGEEQQAANPGVFTPGPYEYVTEVLDATVLDYQQYAIVENYKGAYEHREGPMMLRLTAREKLIAVKNKILLERDQYVRLLDYRTGVEQVAVGPQLVVPSPTELKRGGPDPPVETAIFLDANRAVLILSKQTGIQSLLTAESMYQSLGQTPKSYFAFMPQAYEYILEIRNKRRVLPYQAIVYRNALGIMEIKDPGQHFFLPAYSSIVNHRWSDYSGSANPPGRKFETDYIDLRARQSFFAYTVRTNDNILLEIRGSTFWQINDVSKMMSVTMDPAADVWQRSRSALISEVAKVSWEYFTANLATVTRAAFDAQVNVDDFYDKRGITYSSLEVTSFDCIDPETARKLEEVITETVNRINALKSQNYTYRLESLKILGQTQVEEQKISLLEVRMNNTKLLASTEGKRKGVLDVTPALAFINGLNQTITNESSRIELYKIRQQVLARNADTQTVSKMDATLFLRPADMNMQLGSHS